MITPALFIGLGSTGLKILEKLQSLVLEEYGVPSLPIFRYVAFETDRSVKTSQDSPITLIHPTIESTDAVKVEIKNGNRNYYDWLDESVLGISGGMFVTGAGNTRMAGRLCLWENWQSLALNNQKPGCAAVLQSAHGTIVAGANRTKTTQMLERIYGDWDKPIPPMGIQIDFKPNVYIVGTLCGGTCGGMFIDIAYYVKHLFGLWQRNIGGQRAKVIGVFTVYDGNDLNAATTEAAKSHAANCWATLLEYDYYCHRDSRYQIAFPDGTRINTNERPLDYLYLLSCSGNETNLRTESGGPDEKSLANIAATVLFSETVEGLLGQKERIRIDRLSKPRALAPNKNQHIASLATCGFATFRYPKYRIVESASCRYAIDLCKNWIGTEVLPDRRTTITRETRSIWNTIKNTTRDILIHTDRGLLTDEVNAWFNTNRNDLIAKSSDGVTGTVRNEFGQFGEGKQYDKHIYQRLSLVRSKFLEQINNEIIRRLNDTKNIAETREFLVQLDKVIEDTIKNEKPLKYPAPDLSKVTEDLTSGFWAKSVGKAKDISKEKKEDYLEEMKEEFISQIEGIRDYRIKSVLEEVRQEIGVGEQPPEEWIRAGRRSIKQELDNFENILNDCIKDFQNKAQEMSTEPERTQDVVIITMGRNMAEDTNNLYDTLRTYADSNAILRRIRTKGIGIQQVVIDFHKWLGYGEPRKDKDDLSKSVLDAVREEALQRRKRFIIAAEVLRRPRALGVNLCEFVKNSFPHLQLRGNLASITLGNLPEFICGKDEDVNVGQIKDLHYELQRCPNPVEFDENFIMYMDELDHLLLFYKEEALIYMDENLSTAELFIKKYHDYERFLKTQKDSPSRTVHTHRLQGYFNIWTVIRRKEAIELMQIAQEIFSIRDKEGNWRNSEIFEVAGKSLTKRFKPTDPVITGDNTGIDTLAQNEDIFNRFKELLLDKAKEIGREDFNERLGKLLDWVEEDAKRKGLDPIEERNKKRDEYLGADNLNRLIEVCFPEEEKEEKEND